MRRLIQGLLFIGLLAGSQVASALPILQDQGNGNLQINHFEPLGQSFTAEDAYVSFGFSYYALNRFVEPGELTLNLLAGDGLGGPVLSSSTFSLAPLFEGFHDIDLSAVALSVGERYTVTVSAVGDNPYWGLDFNSGYAGDVYAGGGIVTARPDGLTGHGDIARMDTLFRVNVLTPPAKVPEPGSLALLSVGLLGLALARRKQKASRAS